MQNNFRLSGSCEKMAVAGIEPLTSIEGADVLMKQLLIDQSTILIHDVRAESHGLRLSW